MDEKITIVVEGQDLLSKPTHQASAALGNLQKAATASGGVLHSLANAATAPVRAMGSLVGVLGKVGLAGMGLKVIADGVAGLASSMVSGNAEFERYEVQLGVLLGSADEAKKRLKELADFGARTPFELPEVIAADKVLTAFGLDAKDTAERFGVSAAQIRETIGDVAAGVGANFEEIAGTFGRFASGATGEAIMRFQELGIATREQMAQWGLEFEDSGKLITPAAEAFTILEKHVRDKFGGMMQAQSGTFEGMLSNLQDWLGQTKRALMAPLFDLLKGQLANLLTFLGSPDVQATIGSLATGLAAGIQQAVEAAGRLASGLQTALGNAGRALAPILDPIQRLGFAIRNVVTGQAGIGQLQGVLANFFGVDIGPLVALGQRLAPVADGLQRLGFAIKNVVTGSAGLEQPLAVLTRFLGVDLSAFVGPAEKAADAIRGIVDAWVGLAKTGDFGAFFGKLLSSDAQLFGALAQLQLTVYQWIAEQVPAIVAQLQAWGQAFISWIGPMVPPFLAQLQALAAQAWAWVQGQVPIWTEQLKLWAQAFLDWVQPMAEPLLAQLGGLLEQAWTWVQEQVPVWLAQLQAWGQQMLAWVAPLVPPLLEQLGDLAGRLWTWVQAQAAPLLDQLGAWATAFVAWIVPAAVDFLQRWPKVLDEFLDWIGKAAGPILKQLADWAVTFVKWIAPQIPGILLALGGIAAAILVFVGETALVLGKKLLEWGWAIISWIAPQIPGLLLELGKLLLAISDWFAYTAFPAIRDKAIELGKSIIEGIRAGLRKLSIPLPAIEVFYTDVAGISVPGLKVGVNWQSLADLIPGLAKGVLDFAGGLAVVGERGPELVNLPRGSDVIPLQPQAASVFGGGGTTIHQTIHVHVAGSVIEERNLARTIAEAMRRDTTALRSLAPSLQPELDRVTAMGW